MNRAWLRPFTLIEVVLSFGLIAMLLSGLVFFASYMWRAQGRLKQERGKLIAEQLFYTRLEDALGRCVQLPKPKGGQIINSDAIGFFSDGSQIIFSFRPVVFDKPELNLVQQGRIFIEDESLIFETGPSPALWPQEVCRSLMQRHVWREGVEKLQTKFLYVPILNTPNNKPIEVSTPSKEFPDPGLHEIWSKDYQELPSALVIELTLKKGEVERWPVWIRYRPLMQKLPREGRESSSQDDSTNHDGSAMDMAKRGILRFRSPIHSAGGTS